MIFPIGDTQVLGGHKPIISYTFLAVNIVIFVIQLITPGQLICEGSVIPQDILQGNNLYTLITSMFLHGSIMHVVGNMLFLWIFGDNIEATIGSAKFLLFYLLGGLVASGAHILFDGMDTNMLDCCIPCQNSMVNCGEGVPACNGYIPSLGASGAISALMGAYLVMFPHSKIKMLILIFFRSVYVSAWIFLALWIGQQLLAGIGNQLNIGGDEGVAWWAHIGGFVVGVGAGFLFKKYVKLKNDYV